MLKKYKNKLPKKPSFGKRRCVKTKLAPPTPPRSQCPGERGRHEQGVRRPQPGGLGRGGEGQVRGGQRSFHFSELKCAG